MMAFVVTDSQFPVSSSPRHQPTSRHHTPAAPTGHHPSRHTPTHPAHPKTGHHPSKPKDGHHQPTKKHHPAPSGHHKSAPRGAEQAPEVGGLDLSHTPTLGTLPNEKRSSNA